MRRREIERDIAEAKKNVHDVLTRRAIRAMDKARPRAATFTVRQRLAQAIAVGRTPKLEDISALEKANRG